MLIRGTFVDGESPGAGADWWRTKPAEKYSAREGGNKLARTIVVAPENGTTIGLWPVESIPLQPESCSADVSGLPAGP